MKAKEIVQSVFLLLVLLMCLMFVVDILERTQTHYMDLQSRELLRQSLRPEFGTRPPQCSMYAGVDWQNCMGVGPQ